MLLPMLAMPLLLLAILLPSLVQRLPPRLSLLTHLHLLGWCSLFPRWILGLLLGKPISGDIVTGMFWTLGC
jgi:hypothetical protein